MYTYKVYYLFNNKAISQKMFDVRIMNNNYKDNTVI